MTDRTERSEGREGMAEGGAAMTDRTERNEGREGMAGGGAAMTHSEHAADTSFAALDQLTTEELRERAFAAARQHHDIGFFWSVLRHLPDADDAAALDGSPNSVGPTVDEAVALWRELTGHGYGDHEPLLRAKFIDYLQKR